MKSRFPEGVSVKTPLLGAAALAAAEDPKSLVARDVSPTSTPSRCLLRALVAALIKVEQTLRPFIRDTASSTPAIMASFFSSV
jgi:hypothetical protein